MEEVNGMKTRKEPVYIEYLRQAKIPNIWKQALVEIIKKEEDKGPTKPKSYRPICLLNMLENLQEKFLCKGREKHRNIRDEHVNQYLRL